MKSIKLTFILLVSILTFSITSCKKDKAEQISTSLVGKWTAKSYISTNYNNEGKNSDMLSGDNLILEFSNETATNNWRGETQTTNYTVSEGKIYFLKDILEFWAVTNVRYNINGKVLTLVSISKRTKNNSTATYDYTQTMILERM